MYPVKSQSGYFTSSSFSKSAFNGFLLQFVEVPRAYIIFFY